jgi:hypothetical protein
MRQYYDVYCLLGIEQVQKFIGTDHYLKHKEIRFSKKDSEIPIAKNESFFTCITNTKEKF